jgi:hypothetical protein
MEVNTGISESTLKNLQDRSVEKRKQAAMELQDVVEALIIRKDFNTINARIEMFSKMVYNENI